MRFFLRQNNKHHAIINTYKKAKTRYKRFYNPQPTTYNLPPTTYHLPPNSILPHATQEILYLPRTQAKTSQLLCLSGSLSSGSRAEDVGLFIDSGSQGGNSAVFDAGKLFE